MPRFLPGRPRPLLIGHRGAPCAAPENSIAAFEAALRAGADGIECDARLARDGAVVLHHDETLERTSEGSGPVRDRTLAELRSLRLRGDPPGERIPLLAELLELARGRAGVLVEAKVDRPGEAQPLLEGILGVLRRFGPGEEIALISFDPEAVLLAVERAPNLPRGITYERPFRATEALALRPDLLTVERALLEPALAPPILAAGVELFAYCLDTEEDRRLARACGATGWITNLPDRRGLEPAGP